MITIRNQAALNANMLPHGQRLADGYAAKTCLACTKRVNPNEHAPSIFRFVRDHVQELRPPGIGYALSEPALCHPFNVQIFNRDQSVLVNKFATQLVMKVSTLLPNMGVSTLKQNNGFTSPLRTFLAAVYAAMRDFQRSLLGTIPARIFNYSSVAEGSERAQPNVNTNGGWTKRQRFGFNVTNEERKPASGFALDSEGFDAAFEGAAEPDLYIPKLRHRYLISSWQVLNLAKCKAVESSQRPEPRVANIPASPTAFKKVTEGVVQPLQCMFQHRGVNRSHVWAQGLDLRQLASLIEIANGDVLVLPRVSPLSEARIVKLAADCKVLIKYPFLAFGWIDPVLEGAYH